MGLITILTLLVLILLLLGGIVLYYRWLVPRRERYYLSTLDCTTICSDPDLKKVSGFISDREIEFFIKLGSPKLRPSGIHKDARLSAEQIRTSFSAYFPYKLNWHPTFHRIRCRAASLCNVPTSHIENLQICRYQNAQQFTPHFDFFGNKTSFPEEAGQRVATVLVFLNDLEGEDGRTVFPELHLSVLPEKGAAIRWFNINQDRTPDYRTLHAGSPVSESGEKWIMNIWTRERSLLPHYAKRYLRRYFRKTAIN